MERLKQFQSQSRCDMMDKFDQIKMIELVKVEDPDSEGGLTLVFQENKSLKIKVVDGKLVSEFV